MFRKFQNKFKDLQNTVSNNLAPESADQENAGLICPMCMKRYSTVENLQLCNAKCLSLINQSTYGNSDPPVDPSLEELKEKNKIQEFSSTNNKSYTNENGTLNLEEDSLVKNLPSSESFIKEEISKENGIETNDNVETLEKKDNSKPISSQTSLKLEIEELKKLLEEEKWYSNELKDELNKVQTTNDELQTESEALKKQIKISLETNEELARQKEESNKKYLDIAQQKQEFENAIKQVEDEKKAQNEKLNNQATELEKASNWIRNLESQLVQRPGADDVLVLKKELVRVQQIMYEMSQNDEEKINQKFAEYQSENEQLKIEKIENSKYHEAKQAEVIKQSENIESATSKTLNELHQNLQTEKNLVNSLKEANEILCKEKNELNTAIESLKKDDQKIISELKDKIEEINNEKNEVSSKLLNSSEKLTKSENNYSEKEKELAKMRTQNEAFQLELEQTSSQIQLKSTQIEKLTELLENEKSKAKSLEDNLNEKTEQLERKIIEINGVVSEKDKINEELVNSKKL